MKIVIKGFVSALAVMVMAGCMGVYVPPVPDSLDATLNEYYKLPGNKAFILAVDPSGEYAYAFDYKKDTVKDAVRVATIKCDETCKKLNVLSDPIIYAVNNKIVYKKVIYGKYYKNKEVK